MSGKADRFGERERCPIHGHGRRFSVREIAEMRRAVDVANSRARREGIQPEGPQIVAFSCKCNCFAVMVEPPKHLATRVRRRRQARGRRR